MLTSPKVRDIIERKVATPELARRLTEVENPSRETVKRVMKCIDRFGKDLFEMQWAKHTGRTTNEIVINREAWLDYTETLTDSATERTPSEVDGDSSKTKVALEGLEEETHRDDRDTS